MYSKRRTLAEAISLTNPMVEIPRDAIIDSIVLKCTVVIHNAAVGAYTATLQKILDCLTSVRLVSDGNKVHYSLSGSDLAILNYYRNESIGADPDAAITAAGGADSAAYTFLLTLDEGDILAALKDSLELTVETKTAVDTDVTLKTFSCTVSISENVMTTAEFVAAYGQDAVNSAEPKVTAYEKGFDISEELRECFDFPTGTLLRKAFWIFKDTSGVRAGSLPSKIGIIRTTPDRSEMFTVDYPTIQMINEQQYLLHNGYIPGVVALDYGKEITNDSFGIRAWKFNKGDYQAAIKAAAAGKLRYVSVEYVVNTPTFDALSRALIEASE
jgi:hypothetical protein